MREPIDAALNDDGRRVAVWAEALYLANLLALPGLAFLGLLWLRRRHRNGVALARNHLEQTFTASLWAGGLLVVLNVAILAVGGLDSMIAWLAVILYFTFFHSSFVLCGMFGLASALAGKTVVFPLIGPPDVKKAP
jgi:O-antigen ligase